MGDELAVWPEAATSPLWASVYLYGKRGRRRLPCRVELGFDACEAPAQVLPPLGSLLPLTVPLLSSLRPPRPLLPLPSSTPGSGLQKICLVRFE